MNDALNQKPADKSQVQDGGRSAVAGSGRSVVVGDRYRKNGLIIEIVEVTDDTVAYVYTDYFGNMSGHALTRCDFDRLEDATLKNGADFDPALNIKTQRTANDE